VAATPSAVRVAAGASMTERPPHPEQVGEVCLAVFKARDDNSHVVQVGRLHAQLLFQKYSLPLRGRPAP
jgi:hypothetical protein